MQGSSIAGGVASGAGNALVTNVLNLIESLIPREPELISLLSGNGTVCFLSH
jgi:hypothetical protein